MKSFILIILASFSTLSAFAQSQNVGQATVYPVLMGKTVLVISGKAGFALYSQLPAEQEGETSRKGQQYVCKTEGDPAGSAHCILNVDTIAGTIRN